MEQMNEEKQVQAIKKVWKKSIAQVFFKGALAISLLACVSCGIAYNAIGTYVTKDGMLIEPFGLIPFAWLFALLSVLFAVCLLISRLRLKSK